jgi:uncharacterized protein (DUF433 family)
MVAFVNQPKLGYGVYSVSEVADLLRLPKGKVRYWLNEFWDNRLTNEANTSYSWGEKRDRSVNFYTLIEFYIFYQLRSHRISAARILKAYQLLSKKFNTPYPFASYKIMTDGKTILFSPDGDSIVTVSESLQYNIKGIIEDFLKKIDFEENSQLAARFFPAGKNSSIVVDPHHQFGQPVVVGTNILAATLYAMHKGGEKIETIASLYELKPGQVKDAIRFYQQQAA